MTRKNVINARETERGVLGALEIDNSSSGEVISDVAKVGHTGAHALPTWFCAPPRY